MTKTEKRRYTRIQTRLAIAFALLAALITLVFSLLVYFQARDYLFRQFQNRVLSLAAVAASQQPADLISGFLKPSDQETPLYQTLQQQNSKITESDPTIGSAGIVADSPFRKLIWIFRETTKSIFSINIFCIAKNIVLDGLLQLRLYRLSPSRWLTHGLMVWPFFLRFFWGMAALTASLWAPGRDWPWVMLNKNHPLDGIFFDATGLMIIVGSAIAILRSASGTSAKLPAMPRHDPLASGLLGAIVVGGFVLEGMRIAMTGYPSGSAYAFVGDALSRFFFGVSGLEDIYGYVWYIHAVLTGAFVAYLPF